MILEKLWQLSIYGVFNFFGIAGFLSKRRREKKKKKKKEAQEKEKE